VRAAGECAGPVLTPRMGREVRRVGPICWMGRRRTDWVHWTVAPGCGRAVDGVEELDAVGPWEVLGSARAGRDRTDRRALAPGLRREVNCESPDTSRIPSEREKDLLMPGDTVKLVFEIRRCWGGGPRRWGQRMWARVVSVNGDHLVGSGQQLDRYIEAGLEADHAASGRAAGAGGSGSGLTGGSA
jgi:hypothetical protein